MPPTLLPHPPGGFFSVIAEIEVATDQTARFFAEEIPAHPLTGWRRFSSAEIFIADQSP
jgi:hypothetical protein